MARNAAIRIDNLKEVVAEVQKFDPAIRKSIASGITKVPKEVAKKTRDAVPGRGLTNWGGWSRRGGQTSGDVGALRFDQSAIRSGIKSLSGGKRMNVRLVNRAPSGAAFEMIGSKSPTSQFAQAVAGRHGSQAPRLLVKTWREEKGIKKTAAAVGREMRRAEDALRRAGGS